jgi:hypothetical protein
LELAERIGEDYPQLKASAQISGFATRTINSLGDQLIKAHFNEIAYVPYNKKELQEGEVRRPQVEKGKEVELDEVYFDDRGEKYQRILSDLVDSVGELEAILPQFNGGPDKGPLSTLQKSRSKALSKSTGFASTERTSG